MLTRRWHPFRDIELLRRQFDQMFDDLTHLESGVPFAQVPAIELQDNGNELILKAQLPGLTAENLDIQATREAVAIAGEYRQEEKTEEKGYLRSEFRYGKFRRLVPLPTPIRNEEVKATYKNGVLTLTLPKTEEARNRVVKVNLAGELPQGEVVTEPVGTAEGDRVTVEVPEQ